MTQEQKAKAYDEALERAKAAIDMAADKDLVKGVATTIFPELRESESEDERMMREFNDWLCEEIECRTNDLRDEKDRRTLNMLCYVLTKVKEWLEKQKEPHYTKRNILFDGCVAKCDPAIMKKVSDKVDEMLGKEPKQTDLPAGFYYIDLDGNKYYSKEFRYGDMKLKVREQKPAEVDESTKRLNENWMKQYFDEPKPVPADLEEAAEKYLDKLFGKGKHQPFYKELFIAGYNLCKEQMMKDAVKWLVDDDYDELTDKGRFILGSVGLGYNGYYIPYSDLLKLPKED